MLEIIGDSRAVARAAIQLAMTATREEETELKASLTEKDIVGAASDFGGTFVDSMMKMIERAVVAAKREGVISDTHREEGAVAGAAHDAVCQVSEKAMGFSVGGKIGVGTGTAMVVSFLITAGWWFVCTQPLLKRYRQTAFVEHTGSPVFSTFRQLGRTFREVRQQKHIFLYLLAFFFFIDGVYTIIDMATAYGTALGLDTTGLLLALLLTQFVAFPCSIAFGRFSAKYDTGLLIKICILCYTGITLFAVFLVSQWQFWVLAVLVGMFQGGIQALSRSYLGKIIPAERSGEYFGLMDICGKGASFLGTTLIAVVSQLTDGRSFHVFGLELQNENVAVGTLVVIFAIGFVLFCKADKLNKQYIHI